MGFSIHLHLGFFQGLFSSGRKLHASRNELLLCRIWASLALDEFGESGCKAPARFGRRLCAGTFCVPRACGHILRTTAFDPFFLKDFMWTSFGPAALLGCGYPLAASCLNHGSELPEGFLPS